MVCLELYIPRYRELTKAYSIAFSSSTIGGENLPGFILASAVSVALFNVTGIFMLEAKPVAAPMAIDIVKPGDKPTEASKTILKTEVTAIRNESTPLQTSNEPSMTIKQISKSPVFWLYLCILVFTQGITYMSNIYTILSAYGNGTVEQMQKECAWQLTLISIAQSIGRLASGVMSDYVSKRLGLERTVVLVVSNCIIAIPLIMLSLGAYIQMTSGVLALCSICIGLGFGAAGSLFPILAGEYFGSKNYGTACSFLLSPVPVGIMTSNLVFATFYDQALLEQNGNVGNSLECVGYACFTKSFAVLAAIQVLMIVQSGILLSLRTNIKRKQMNVVTR